MTTRSFTSKIFKVGINPCVDVPRGISDAFAAEGRRGQIPVKGLINESHEFRSTLVPLGGGSHRLFTKKRGSAEAQCGQGY